MKILLIVLNLLATVLVFPAMNIVQSLDGIKFTMMYVELDRSQVIDHSKLKEAFPDQAENDRIKIPKMLSNRGVPAVWFLGYPCILGFVLNAALVGIFWRQEKPYRAEQGAAANP